ncbi:hypothetical protein RGQ21_00180 [Kitasatospora aureofaciens]|uniref:hypothetical protein n=1 Tax=Streptomyces TaxID=1883 RepID=UPI00099DC236|nr:hypothetical protein [Streptomyces sp. NRRL F-4707]BET45036.1 hypothetical protein RGQ21_00180 [Kitasatospora aureofaciens]
MAHHALEVLLTRSARPAELRAATRHIPLAVNADSTRLMAICPGKTAGRAARRLRRHLTTSLPIDVITTHYPDTGGHVLLNVAFTPTAHAALRHRAEQTGHTPEQALERALHRALAQHDRNETDRLSRALSHLMTGTTPAHLLAAVGQVLARTRTPGATP